MNVTIIMILLCSHILQNIWFFHRSTCWTKGLPLLKEEKKMTMQHVTFSTTCMQRRAFAKEAPSLSCDWHFSYARLQRHSKDIQKMRLANYYAAWCLMLCFFCFLWNLPPKNESFHHYLLLQGNQSRTEETVAHAGTVRLLISNPAVKWQFGWGPLKERRDQIEWGEERHAHICTFHGTKVILNGDPVTPYCLSYKFHYASTFQAFISSWAAGKKWKIQIDGKLHVKSKVLFPFFTHMERKTIH